MTCTLWTRWKQRIRLVGMVAFIVAGVLAGAHYYLLWSAEWDLRRAAREADQLDPSWRLQDLEARRDAIADPENSARKVTAVKMAMASRWPNLQRVSLGPGRSTLESDMEIDLGNQFGRLPPDMQLSPDVTQVFSGVMKYSARVLDRARDLVRYPRGRYAIEYPQNLRNVSPDSEQASIVANLLWADALLEAQKQKPDQALFSAMAMLNVGRSIGDEPIAGSQLKRVSIDQQCIRTMERILAQGRPTPKALEAAQRLMEDEASEPLLLHALRAERAAAYHLMVAIQSGKMRYRLRFYHGRLARQLPSSWHHYVDMVIVRRAQPDYFRLLTALVEIAKLPAEEWAAHIQQLSPRAEQLPIEFKSWFQSAAGSVGPFQTNLALLRCAQAAVAAERFRLAHGQWPHSLSSLVPEFFQEEPTDPFDGQPLRFRRCDHGVMIYSVGPDGKDDGGNLDRQNTQSGNDVGFQLCDVAARRQAWRPPPEPVSDDKAEEASEPVDP